MTVETSNVTVQQMSTGENIPYVNPNDVQFKVAYKEGFKGPKYMPEGETVTISKESAEDFTKRGMGAVISAEADKKAPAADEPEPVKQEEKQEEVKQEEVASNEQKEVIPGPETETAPPAPEVKPKADKKASAADQTKK